MMTRRIMFAEPVWLPTFGWVDFVELDRPILLNNWQHRKMSLGVVSQIEGIDSGRVVDIVMVDNEWVLYALVFACRQAGVDLAEVIEDRPQGVTECLVWVDDGQVSLAVSRLGSGKTYRTRVSRPGKCITSRDAVKTIDRYRRELCHKGVPPIYGVAQFTGWITDYVKVVKLADELAGRRLP